MFTVAHGLKRLTVAPFFDPTSGAEKALVMKFDSTLSQPAVDVSGAAGSHFSA